MILTRIGVFDSGWPAHKNLPIFKKCFHNRVSLKTGSKVIALLWMLLFTILGFIELRTALNETAEEQLQLHCLFNQSSSGQEPCHDVRGDSDGDRGIFLYGNYRFILNETSGSVTGMAKYDDGLYEWNIFCVCILYSSLLLLCLLLYTGIICDRPPFILTWLGVLQIILLLEVATVVFNFVFLVKNDHYLEYLSFSLLLHMGFVGFILYSLLIVNSYVLSTVDSPGNLNSMVG